VEGSVRFQGRELREMGRDDLRRLRGRVLALIPQSPGAALDPVLRVGHQIDEMYVDRHGKTKSEAKRLTLGRLSEVGFGERERIYRAYPHHLSGGMCERALIAMGTALHPQLLIADEPTKGLDPASKMDVLGLLKRQSQGRTMLLITHDFHAPWVCDRVAIMYAGQIVEDGPVAKILTAPCHPYTQGLWAALPSRGMVPIPGSVGRDWGEGCRFRGRCSRSGPECEGPQGLRGLAEGHSARCCHA
jgi:peptide/nickel transport system ATP-binding protein